MVKNNIEVVIKTNCIENGMTQVQLAESVGTSGPYVNRLDDMIQIYNHTEKICFDDKNIYMIVGEG